MGRGLTPADFRLQVAALPLGVWRDADPQGALALAGPNAARSRAASASHLTGWFSWFADALHLAFTVLALTWTIGMIAKPKYFPLPLDLFIYPILGFFVFKAAFGINPVRVPCSWKTRSRSAAAVPRARN